MVVSGEEEVRETRWVRISLFSSIACVLTCLMTGRRWQKLRAAEIQFEKEMKEQALLTLTTREREIRKRMEDIVDPQARMSTMNGAPYSSPQKPSSKPSINGHTKARSNGDAIKKGKKKKTEIS